MNRPKVNFKVEKWVKLADLKEHPKNPRKDLLQNPEKFASLKQSILEGVFEAVKVSSLSGFCLAGNQRLKAFADLGFDEVPVQVNEYETEKEEIRDMIKDNNEWGSYDYPLLSESLKGLELDIDALGFNEIDLKAMQRIEDTKGNTDEDYIPNVSDKSKTKIGDVFKLGEHRLMCGDATNLEHIDKLMGGMRADMVFTDPPYNVNYQGSINKTWSKINNDNVSRENFRAFLEAAFLCYRDAAKTSAPFYVCHSSKYQREFEDAMEAVGLHVRNQIIWNKKLAVLGWGDYRWKHEPIFYAVFDKSKSLFYGDRSQYTVWDEKWDEAKLIENIKNICEKQEKGASTVWTLGIISGEYVHPTQKPIELIEIALKNSSKEQDLIVDLFGGSGSTLIGAEKTKRVCYTMELEPKYVDVIRKRWEDYTGEKAEQLN